jgi:hypothetical protein
MIHCRIYEDYKLSVMFTIESSIHYKQHVFSLTLEEFFLKKNP